MNDLEDFERLASALTPWLDELVVVGGWAHRLHREHPLAQAPTYAPIRTRDADVAFGARSRLKGTIAGALARAGFREELSSDETPPIAQYRLGTDDEGFYVEFLTPLTGSGTRRDGSADATEARAGIVAQKLRHLEVLLVAPWRLPIGGGDSKYIESPIEIQVANPVSFAVQKLLIHANRTPRKRAQDVLYVHDTIQLFGGSLPDLRQIWLTKVKGALTSALRKRITEVRERLFASVSDTLREAALIPADRKLRPEDIRAVCESGLSAILAGD